jgi:hypothetical protein
MARISVASKRPRASYSLRALETWPMSLESPGEVIIGPVDGQSVTM